MPHKIQGKRRGPDDNSPENTTDPDSARRNFEVSIQVSEGGAGRQVGNPSGKSPERFRTSRNDRNLGPVAETAGYNIYNKICCAKEALCYNNPILMLQKHQRITAVIFLFYFSFFAVSQITYNVSDRQAGLLFSKDPHYPLVQLKFSLADLLPDYSAEQNPDKDDSTELVLLRKKRAVLSSQKGITKLSQLHNGLTEDQDFSFASCLSHSLFALHDFTPRPGFLKFRSGLSPPSA